MSKPTVCFAGKNEGVDRVNVTWMEPSYTNGVINQYLLYVSSDLISAGSVVYNGTRWMVSYTITGLKAGTTYYARLLVCLITYLNATA